MFCSITELSSSPLRVPDAKPCASCLEALAASIADAPAITNVFITVWVAAATSCKEVPISDVEKAIFPNRSPTASRSDLDSLAIRFTSSKASSASDAPPVRASSLLFRFVNSSAALVTSRIENAAIKTFLSVLS